MQESIRLAIREELREVIRTEMVAMEHRLTKIIEQKFKEKIIPVTLKLIEAIQELNQKVDQCEQFNLTMEERMKELEKENEKIKENFNFVEGQVDLTNMEERLKELEKENGKINENFNFVEGQLDLIQLNQTQRVLRLRGIKEQKGERLMDVSSRVLAQLINVQPLDITAQIEKIYRVNSRIALQNNWPRDIVIHVINKGLRDEIVQAAYNREIQWQNLKVRVFKEIPSRILARRKEYFFLTNELKNRQIRYKWELPYGLSLIYQDKKYFLNTIQKAEDFYKDVLVPGILLSHEPEQSQETTLVAKKVENTVLLVTEKKKKMENNEVTSSPGSGKRSKKAKNQTFKK